MLATKEIPGECPFHSTTGSLACDCCLCCEKNLPKPKPEAVWVTQGEGLWGVQWPCLWPLSGLELQPARDRCGGRYQYLLCWSSLRKQKTQVTGPRAWFQEDMVCLPCPGPQFPQEAFSFTSSFCSPCQIQSHRERGQSRMCWTFDRTWKRPCPAFEAPR